MRPLTWDYEDRLTSASGPGYSDTFTYTGLGLRLTKNDSTGGYAYLCDGVSPASSILSDGRLSFTPGISQTLGTPNGAGGLNYASHFYAADALGTLRGMTDGSAQGFSDGLNFDGFGNLVGRVGNTSVPLGYGEGSGYVTDADTGLRLLGHRYYDSRTGRFISRDPAGAGDNWYAYADNNPVNEVDPLGLEGALVGTLNLPGSWTRDQVEDYVGLHYDDGDYKVTQGGKSYTFTINTMQNVGGLMMQVPPRQDFNSTIAAARNYASKINNGERLLAANGPSGLLAAGMKATLEADKAKWYLDHFGYKKIGDPKHWNLKFDNFGKFQAGAAAAAMGYAMIPYLEGAQAVHIGAHPFEVFTGQSPFENLDMTEAGYLYYGARYGNQ